MMNELPTFGRGGQLSFRPCKGCRRPRLSFRPKPERRLRCPNSGMTHVFNVPGAAAARSTPGVAQGYIGRDRKWDHVAEGNFPKELVYPIAADDDVSLVEGGNDGAHNHGGQNRAAQHRPVPVGAPGAFHDRAAGAVVEGKAPAVPRFAAAAHTGSRLYCWRRCLRLDGCLNRSQSFLGSLTAP